MTFYSTLSPFELLLRADSAWIHEAVSCYCAQDSAHGSVCVHTPSLQGPAVASPVFETAGGTEACVCWIFGFHKEDSGNIILAIRHSDGMNMDEY